jgi:hypothetical protein
MLIAPYQNKIIPKDIVVRCALKIEGYAFVLVPKATNNELFELIKS